jgi:type II secretory ATPase GspE/PulE/Tfp pilus assembly ATPase PilB-like protein
MERLILDAAPVTDIQDLAVKEGMVTMLQDGYLKLLEGITSLEEVHRVLG